MNLVVELDELRCLSTISTSGVRSSKIPLRTFVGQFSCPPNTEITFDIVRRAKSSAMFDVSECTERYHSLLASRGF